MKLSLSENIGKLRRAHSMTQQQLAEALGVTFAAVSKWERGVAAPELSLIAEMADLFAVSIDALIGYQFQNHDRQTIIARLKQASHERSGETIVPELENALRRYPNCFEIVYYSALIYQMQGLVQNNSAYTHQALSLYRQACLLLSQNTDPNISEITIRLQMAQAHLALEEYEQGLALLKQYNPHQLNHGLIGYTLASSCNDPQGALPYLSMALLNLTQSHMEIVMGYLNVYAKTENYEEALVLLDWALAFFPGLRRPETRCYLDKSEASLRALRAWILLSLRQKDAALHSLRQAKALALQFDSAPSYDARRVRFTANLPPATAFDDMGDTVILSLDRVIAAQTNTELSQLWEVVKHEE